LGMVVLLARKSLCTIPLMAVPLVFPMLYYITHTSLRYRHPIDPIVLLLAALGFHAGWQFFRRLFSGRSASEAVITPVAKAS